jgi:hydroxyacylglutathione hydrolase
VESIPEHQQKTFPSDKPSRQVHTITDRYSIANTYIINDERMVIVDPSSELNVRLALQYLQQILRRTPAEIDLIVLTHLLPDQTAGIKFLRRTGSIPVAASAQEARRATARVSSPPLPAPRAGCSHHRPYYDADAEQIKMVDVWLEDVAALHQHPDWRVIASPGHAPASLCLYNPFTYELLCGDTVITREGGTPLLHGVTNRQAEETLSTLRSLEVHYLYSGHGRALLGQHPLANLAVEW